MTLPDVNVVLNVLMIVGLVCAVPLLARAVRLKSVIGELEAVVRSLKERVTTLEDDLTDERQGRTDAEQQVASWRARYEEQSKYTAEPALVEVRDSIRSMDATTATALSSLGELVMKSNELLARLHGSFGFREGDRPQ